MSDPLRHAIGQLARFPGIGERTATRLAYWLLRQPPDVAEEIAAGVLALRTGMTRCSTCCNVAGSDPCPICAAPDRDAGLVCVVERPQDVAAIEASGGHRGRYHVLDGAVSPLDGVGPDDLRVRELLARVQRGEVREAVLATDPDVEGDATALYLAALLKPLGVRVTRLAHGISVGTEIEYADKSSVVRALENRREL
ncbi:recombination mediator RecR [Myxococcota bacterium]|nr:recombination mediator RecR [Myxococcota bacterium]